ncbi:MAG: hypothetical protein ACE5O2_03505, partial [Armatimonadota bacterium]
MNEPYLRFANDAALHLLWLVPVAAALYAFAFRRKEAALRAFVGTTLAKVLLCSVSRRRQVAKAVIVLAAGALGILALSRPQVG